METLCRSSVLCAPHSDRWFPHSLFPGYHFSKLNRAFAIGADSLPDLFRLQRKMLFFWFHSKGVRSSTRK
jgi:hypothetical protein